MMKQFPLGKRILVVTAHPDDESYVAAGTLYANFRAGGRNDLVCATYGEKGTSHLRKPTTPAQLKRIRYAELKAAAKILSIRTVSVVGIPDGSVGNGRAQLISAITRRARLLNPDIIIGFGPDGISGHRDHVAAGSAARRVAATVHVRYYSFSLPPSLRTVAQRYLSTRRHAGHYVPAVRYRKPKFRVTVNQMVKRRALGAHRSQMDSRGAFTGFPAFAVRILLQSEYFT